MISNGVTTGKKVGKVPCKEFGCGCGKMKTYTDKMKLAMRVKLWQKSTGLVTSTGTRSVASHFAVLLYHHHRSLNFGWGYRMDQAHPGPSLAIPLS